MGLGLSALMVIGSLGLSSNLPVSSLTPVLEKLLSQKIDGEVSITGLALSVYPETFEFRADRVFVAGQQSATLDRPQVELSFAKVLRRQFLPKGVSVARIDAVTRPTGAPAPEGELPVERILAFVSSGAAGQLRMPDLSISYAASDEFEPVRLDGGSVFAAPGEEGYAIRARLPFVLGTRTTEATLDVLARPGGVTDIVFASNGTPIDPFLAIAGIDVVTLNTDIRGDVVLSLDALGVPLEGKIDLALSGGEGRIVDQPFRFGDNEVFASFAPGSPHFDIERLRYDVANNRGELRGKLQASNMLNPSAIDLGFDFYGANIHVDLGEIMEGPLDVAEIRAKGSFNAAARKISFDELKSTYFGSTLRGFLALTFPPGFSSNPRLEANAELPGPLTPEQVLAGWPYPLARSAREWVQESLSGGQLTNLRYTADIPMGAIRPQTPLDNDTMRFTFDTANATVTYLPTMPPLRKLRASATVLGNSFEIIARGGDIAGVQVERGRLFMPRFSPSGSIVTFGSRLVGEVPTVLKALEASSLVEFSEDGYQPDAFQGRGSFDLKVTWPLRADVEPDDVEVSGEGVFARGGIDNVLPGIDATDAEGRVMLTPQLLTVRGGGLAAAAPATFVWRQALTGDRRANLFVNAQLDSVAADMAGLPLRQFVNGQVDTEVYADDLSPGSPLRIIGDMTQAEFSIPDFGLTKPRGEEGSLEATIALPEPGANGQERGNLVVDAMRINAPNFNIEGNGLFTPDGGVLRLELPRVFIQNTADLALRLSTQEGFLDIDVDGLHADGAPFIDAFFSAGGGGGPLPGRSRIEMALQRLSLKAGIEVTDVTAAGLHDGQDFDNLNVAGQLPDGGTISIEIDHPQEQELGDVDIAASDFGALAQGVFGLTSVQGGVGTLKGTTIASGGFRGRLEVGELLVREAPILAKLLAVGSLDGLADVLSGEGIRFTELEGDVWVKDGQLGLGDAKLVGSSLGLSGSGVIDFAQNAIDVRGAIAPAYGINSVLGTLPGVGRLFVPRDGEGVLAFSYSITGSLDQPMVTVNALSALTPGILRRVLEPLEDDADKTREFLDAAIAAAEKEGRGAAPRE